MLAAARGMFEFAANVIRLRRNAEGAAARGHGQTQAVDCAEAGPVGGMLPPGASRVLSLAVMVVAVLTFVASPGGTPRGGGTVFGGIRNTQPPTGCGDGWRGTDSFGSSVTRVPPLRANMRGRNTSGHSSSVPWPDGGGCGMAAYAGAPPNSVEWCPACGGNCPCNPDDGLCYEENMRGPDCRNACQDCYCVTIQEPCTETFPDQSVDGVDRRVRSAVEPGPARLDAQGMSAIICSN